MSGRFRPPPRIDDYADLVSDRLAATRQHAGKVRPRGLSTKQLGLTDRPVDQGAPQRADTHPPVAERFAIPARLQDHGFQRSHCGRVEGRGGRGGADELDQPGVALFGETPRPEQGKIDLLKPLTCRAQALAAMIRADGLNRDDVAEVVHATCVDLVKPEPLRQVEGEFGLLAGQGQRCGEWDGSGEDFGPGHGLECGRDGQGAHPPLSGCRHITTGGPRRHVDGRAEELEMVDIHIAVGGRIPEGVGGVNPEVGEDLQVAVNAPRAILGTMPPAAQPVVQVGERGKGDVGGAKAGVRPQIEEHEKQPLGALGRKPVLRVRMDRPGPRQAAVWPVDGIGEGVGLQAGGRLPGTLRSPEADPGEIGQIHVVVGGSGAVNGAGDSWRAAVGAAVSRRRLVPLAGPLSLPSDKFLRKSSRSDLGAPDRTAQLGCARSPPRPDFRPFNQQEESAELPTPFVESEKIIFTDLPLLAEADCSTSNSSSWSCLTLKFSDEDKQQSLFSG